MTYSPYNTDPTDPGLAEFQKANCVGCRFADKRYVGTGAGCCTYPGQVKIDEREDIPVCLSRREDDPFPQFRQAVMTAEDNRRKKEIRNGS